MSHPEIIETTFPEELYSVPAKPVIVLKQKWSELAETEITLLENVLKSASLKIDQFKIIISDQLDILNWNERPKQVIAIGLAPAGLSLNEVLDIQGVKLVATVGLDSLASQDKAAKLKIKASLLELFSSN